MVVSDVTTETIDQRSIWCTCFEQYILQRKPRFYDLVRNTFVFSRFISTIKNGNPDFLRKAQVFWEKSVFSEKKIRSSEKKQISWEKTRISERNQVFWEKKQVFLEQTRFSKRKPGFLRANQVFWEKTRFLRENQLFWEKTWFSTGFFPWNWIWCFTTQNISIKTWGFGIKKVKFNETQVLSTKPMFSCNLEI